MSLKLSNIVASICSLYFPKSAERNIDIIETRFGLNKKEIQTLDSIGKKYGLTRERIRQIEERVCGILKDIIIDGVYIKKTAREDKSYYLEKDSKECLDALIKKLALNGLYISESGVRNVLPVYDTFKWEINLMLYCLGYEYVDQKSSSRFSLEAGWIYTSRKNDIYLLLESLNQEFYNKNSMAIDAILNKNAQMTSAEIMLIVENINGFCIKEENGKTYISIEFNKLSTMDKVYYIIQQTGPISIDKLTQKINESSKNIYTENNIRNQMVNDARFSAIGKSGIWMMSENEDIENISIVDAIEKTLTEKGKPLTKLDILNGVKQLRGSSFKEKSITTYLNTDDRFCLLKNGLFGLSAWGMEIKPKKKKINMDNFNQEILNLIGLNNTVPLKSVVNYFTDKGWIEVSIRTKLTKLKEKGIVIYSDAYTNKDITLVKNPLTADEIKKEGVIVSIQSKIMQYLKANPNQKITKGALYKTIDPNRIYLKQTFYRALSELKSENISFSKEQHSYFVEYIS